MFNPFTIFDEVFLKISSFQGKYEPILELSRVLPIVGYLMIFMTLIDFANILIPPQLQNPEWELVALDALSNHSWALLIGTGFIVTGFSGRALERVRFIEVRLLMVIRWGLLLLGISYLLSLALIFSNTNRLISQVKTNFSQQIQAREQVINQVEANIDGISNPNQLLQIAQTLGISITNPGVPSDQLKQQIQQQLPQMRQKLPEQAAKAQNGQIRQLIKRSLRTASQLFLLALANALVWFKTRQLNLFLF